MRVRLLVVATVAALVASVALPRLLPVGHSGRALVRPEPMAVPVLDAVPVLLAAGDIATCAGDADEATGRLLAEQPGVVVALGDLAYPDGSERAFRECWEPAWGQVRDRTLPAMGNHDARTPDAAGYFATFGELAGPEPQGYHSYDLGSWHVVVLNSNCGMVGGCGPDSPQVAWLEEDLAATTTRNIAVYWHHPRWSTGHHGDTPAVATFWEVLVEAGADLVLSGHDHDYQRFVPLDAGGSPDPDGAVAFVVGTGGIELRALGPDRDTVAFRQDSKHGVLRVELEACGFDWAFLAVDGEQLDAGQRTGTC